MIVGVGVDVCSVARFADAAARPHFLERVFRPDERAGRLETLAGRWAAKEALAKALGAPAGLAWHDCRVARAASGAPGFETTGTVRARLDELGIRTIHLSLSHDAGLAVAMVVCES